MALAMTSLASARADGITFRDKDAKFRLVYPDTWARKTPRGSHVRLLVASTHASNCNVVVLSAVSESQMPAALEPGVWSEADWKELLGGGFPDAAFIERRAVEMDNWPAQLVVLDTPYETAAARINGRMVISTTLRFGNLYSITCGAYGPTPDQAAAVYEQERATLMGIIGSFVFENY